MEKEINVEYIHLSNLSITNLLNCLKDSNVKEQFKNDIGDQKYQKIVKEMRNESTIIAMRDLHNWIKNILIANTVILYKQTTRQAGQPQIALLDIAVGRGGDLAKWNKAGINYVYGFDVSDKSINSKDPEDQGAKERLSNFKNIRIKDVHFEVGNAMKPSVELKRSINGFLENNKLELFNIVSCQFALHYFFKSEETLRNVLKMVSDSLSVGGFFIGTTIDGDAIKKLFKNTKERVYSTQLFRIERNFPKTVTKPFGNEYSFTIFDTFDKSNYFNTMGVSTEYLVNFKKLEEVAKDYSLELIKVNLFDDYSLGKTVKFTEVKKSVISFEDIHELGKWKHRPENREITEPELEINKLYSAFIFKKVN